MDGLTVKKTFVFSWKVVSFCLRFLLKLFKWMLGITLIMGVLMAVGNDDD